MLLLVLMMTLEFTAYTSQEYTYIKSRPLNIAHRGLSSILPGSTLQAFEAAMYTGADFIELDVVFAKNGELLVTHDPYLSNMTNIASMKQFSNRTQNRCLNGTNITDWWVDNFTLTQLQQLTFINNQNKFRTKHYHNNYTFTTLKNVIQSTINFNRFFRGRRNPDGNLVGILIEAKNQQMYHSLLGLNINEHILQLLAQFDLHNYQSALNVCPIWLQSFDFNSVKYLAQNTNLPVNFLLSAGTPYNLTDIALYVRGIGVQETLIWDRSEGKTTPMLDQIRQKGLLVHLWTFKDDDLILGVSTNLEMYHIAQNIIQVDGVITDFADVYTPIAQLQIQNPICNQISKLFQNIVNAIY